MDKKSKGIDKLVLGMILLAFGGLILGGSVGYYCTNVYLSRSVLSDLQEEGYVLTSDATATQDDIISGKTAYVDGELITGTVEVLDTSDATATADYILKGKTAYVNGELVVGTLDTAEYDEAIASTSDIAYYGYVYLTKDFIIKGDENLIASNIKKGVTIFGIKGTYTPSAPVTEDTSEETVETTEGEE